MVISVGEILLDVFSNEKESSLEMNGKIGGAPFNVAANISLIEGNSKFYGSVGDDQFGEFLSKRAGTYGLNQIILDKNKNQNTTIAMVSLKDGERNFSFMRGADCCLKMKSLEKLNVSIGDILHLGSLMLSKEEGRVFFFDAVRYAKRSGAYVSFDANLRLDIFKNENEARKIYSNVFKEVDILKLSEDELRFFGCDSSELFFKRYMKKDGLLFATYGSKGSELFSLKKNIFAPSSPIEVVDSTGAGDAFFARVLKELDELEIKLTSNNIDFERILTLANEDGGKACLHYGAI